MEMDSITQFKLTIESDGLLAATKGLALYNPYSMVLLSKVSEVSELIYRALPTKLRFRLIKLSLKSVSQHEVGIKTILRFYSLLFCGRIENGVYSVLFHCRNVKLFVFLKPIENHGFYADPSFATNLTSYKFWDALKSQIFNLEKRDFIVMVSKGNLAS